MQSSSAGLHTHAQVAEYPSDTFNPTQLHSSNMKFSPVVATLFTFVVASLALPAPTYITIDDLIERALGDLEVLNARDWVDLYVRTGPFNEKGKTTGTLTKAKDFVDEARRKGKLTDAAARGDSARTVYHDETFHLDRQQPANAQGQRKVAVQLNHVSKGEPSTIGQVALHGAGQPLDRKVADKLKHSLTTGREAHLVTPDKTATGKKAGKQPARAKKQARVGASSKAGSSRAGAGQKKKGK